ncbi:LolA-like protein [Streptomyces griseosporeus]|uniref:DUF1396 domain-containing protein n=1 Tax=Streptomyces griseosporeus TaxID=1910 RepID=UPI00367C98F6
MKRAVSTAALAALLLAGAVGCGKGEQSPHLEPAAAVARAAKNADAVTSFRYRLDGKVPGEGRVRGEAAMSVKPPAMSMKITPEGQADTGPVEIRFVDKAMYVNGGAEAADEMDGKSWIKFDMSKAGAGKEANPLAGAGGTAEQNPAAQSTFLTEAEDVREVGTETVDGVKTTHYQGTATLDALKKSLKGTDKATRDKRQKSLDEFAELGIDKLSMDLWVDGEDHTKRFRMRGDADKGPLDMTITFYDVNKPVTVTAPPAKDVADLAEMMKGLEG